MFGKEEFLYCMSGLWHIDGFACIVQELIVACNVVASTVLLGLMSLRKLSLWEFGLFI